MSRRANILARLRSWQTRAARYVVAAFALAYLAVGVAPCATAATPSTGETPAALQADGHREQAAHGAHATDHAHVGHAVHGASLQHGDGSRALEHDGQQCPHCPAGAAMDKADSHSSCFALDSLTDAAASQAKDVPQPLSPSFAPAAFTLPPPLPSPAPPLLRAAELARIPLNVRHCVFLI